MRVLVLSDIHSNLDALDAVLADAGQWDMIWALGDTVGYGPEPNECIARLQQQEHLAILGNHDWGVLGRSDLQEFNSDARVANVWTRAQLSAPSRTYLEGLAATRQVPAAFLAHGSPRDPIWEYLLYLPSARASFAHFDGSLCFVGHTHVPVVFRQGSPGGPCQAITLNDECPLALEDGRYIINPGSVGQPRDADPRAAYLLLDTERHSVQLRRVSYDIARVQAKMQAAGLPPRLIARLDWGW